MSAIVAINAASAVLFAALAVLALAVSRQLPRYAQPLRFLAIAFFIVDVVAVSNILERVAGFSVIDRFEEYEEILILPFVLLFAHSWTSARRLERSETYLRELHHRVKNNLQVVESILSLAEGENACEGRESPSLAAARTRIEVIGIAEKMALDSSPPGLVEMDACFREVAFRVSSRVPSRDAPGEGDPRTRCAIDCGGAVLHSSRALPCGLLAAEALMAAAGGGAPLAIRLAGAAGGRHTLRFEGFPPFGEGLQSALAEAFVRQLDAEVTRGEGFIALEFDGGPTGATDLPGGLPCEPAGSGP